jgi:hypothetical protein
MLGDEPMLGSNEQDNKRAFPGASDECVGNKYGLYRNAKYF